MRADGGREERCQEAIGTGEDGGREGRQEETQVNVKIERDCGREEANIFTLILSPVLQNSPEADRTTAEGDTSWPRGNTSMGLKCPLL